MITISSHNENKYHCSLKCNKCSIMARIKHWSLVWKVLISLMIQVIGAFLFLGRHFMYSLNNLASWNPVNLLVCEATATDKHHVRIILTSLCRQNLTTVRSNLQLNSPLSLLILVLHHGLPTWHLGCLRRIWHWRHCPCHPPWGPLVLSAPLCQPGVGPRPGAGTMSTQWTWSVMTPSRHHPSSCHTHWRCSLQMGSPDSSTHISHEHWPLERQQENKKWESKERVVNVCTRFAKWEAAISAWRCFKRPAHFKQHC